MLPTMETVANPDLPVLATKYVRRISQRDGAADPGGRRGDLPCLPAGFKRLRVSWRRQRGDELSLFG